MTKLAWFYNHGNNFVILTFSTNSVQNKRKHRKCEHFLSYYKCSKCLLPAFTYSLNIFLKLGTDTAENFPMFSPLRLFSIYCIQKLHLASDATFRKASCIAPRTWYLQRGQIWRVRRPLFLLNIYRQYACRNCWATRAVCTEPHASHWICLSVRQQSVAVFNKL